MSIRENDNFNYSDEFQSFTINILRITLKVKLKPTVILRENVLSLRNYNFKRL